MKRALCFLLAIILMMQTACGSKAGETSQASKEKRSDIRESIREQAIAIDKRGVLKKIPFANLGAGHDVEGLYLFQDNLLIAKSDELTLISLENGTTLHEVKIPNTFEAMVQICGDKIAVNDAAYGGMIRIYDSKLELIARYELEEEYDDVYVNGDATKVFCSDWETELFLMDLETGEAEVLLEEANSHDMEESAEEVSFVDLSDGTTYGLDYENNSLREMPFPHTYWLVSQAGDKWLAQQTEDWNSYYVGDSTQYFSFTWKGEEFEADMAVVDGPASLYIKDEKKDCDRVTLYDMEGKVVSQYTSQKADWNVVTEPLWCEKANGYFLIASSGLFGNSSLLFWDLEVPTKGKALELTLENSYGEDLEEERLQTCYNRAADLAQKYGVEIKIGEQCEVEFKDHRAERETSTSTISAALDALDKALSVYPQGLLQQLTYGGQQKIEISFVGDLIKMSPSDYGSGAFVSSVKGKNILIADITSGKLEQTFYHEIMHLMDRRIEYDTNMGKNNVYNEDAWKVLNPEGFAYKESYKVIEDEEYKNAYQEWFVDSYAKTYTTEDRARIMENAAAGNVEVFEGKPQLVAKLEYLCQYLRRGFDTTGWPEKTVWEETLEKCK